MSIPVDSRRAFEERLQTLQREYRANLPKTVAALEEEVRALGAGSTSERWTSVMGLAHRIIGAATTFGHPGLGRAGRQIQSLAERRRLAPQNFSSQERWTLAEAMEEVRQSLTFGTLRASGVTGDYRAVSGSFPAVAGETVPDAALPKQRTLRGRKALG
jgi:HPt (histidine-containing phosphotransfer) domain-containing protein